MDTDLPRLVVVHPQLDRLPAPSPWRPAPADGGPHPALEEALVESVPDLLEVEVAPLGGELLVGGVAFLADPRLLPADEIVEHPTGPLLASSGVVGHCP